MKRAKRFLVFCLSCVLALSTATLVPITARAEEGNGNVFLDCGAWWSAHTDGYAITEEIHSYTFRSQTKGDSNWHTPAFVIYNSEDGKVGGAGYKEYAAIRSDDFYINVNNINITKVSGGGPASWDEWLAANKSGVDCSVTTQMCNGNVLVGVSNNGLTATYVIPVDTSVASYLSLSGEQCTLSNLQTSDQHIDLSAAREIANPGTEEPGDIFLDCGAWWSAHTDGYAITEEIHTYAFRSQTKGDSNWHTPAFVIYNSEDGKVGGAGYKEYAAIRSDDFYINVNNINITKVSGGGPASWDEWLAANKSGVDCSVTTQMCNGNVLVGVSNNGLTATYVIPVDTSVASYLSLSGEQCTLSNLQTSDQHIDLSAAREIANPGPEEPDPDTPGGVFLDCDTFWGAHTEGFEITEEPHTYKFHSKTDEGKTNNWETPLFVVFHSDNGLVNGDGYREYGVIRSDNWYWDGVGTAGAICKATEQSIPGDDAAWAAWQAANRNGVECIVTTQKYKDCVLIGVSNNGLTTTYAVPVDQTVKNYVSLTGEYCVLSDLQTSDQHLDLSATKVKADNRNNPSNSSNNDSGAPAAPAAEVRAVAGGEILSGSAWWSGMAIGSNQLMSGDGTWTWVVQANSLIDGYGAFSVEIYDPATNGYITTGSDMNAWTAEGFDPAKATVIGVPAQLASELVEGHAYVVTVTRSGNSFAVQYVDYAENREICTLVITPGEIVSNDVQIHVMAQVGTYLTAFCEGALVDAPAAKKAATSGEVLKGTEWWNGMMRGTDHLMSGDGTWTWTVKASSLMDGYGAFSVEIYDPSTNGYITTGSDKNAWTAEGFDPAKAVVSGVPSQLDSKLVQGHTYAVTVTRSGNTFTVRYADHTTGKEICTLVITPGEIAGRDVQIHVMAQVGTFATAFSEGTLIAALGDSVPVWLYAIGLIGIAAILFGFKKRFTK